MGLSGREGGDSAIPPAASKGGVWAPAPVSSRLPLALQETEPVRTTPFRLLVLLLAVALVGTLGVSSAGAANKVGAVAPAISITDGINGVTAKTKISDYKGSVTLFVIWLPVCPHCKKFMPTVPAMQKKYEKKGLEDPHRDPRQEGLHAQVDGRQQVELRRRLRLDRSHGQGLRHEGHARRVPDRKDGRLRSYTGSLDAAIYEELRAK